MRRQPAGLRARAEWKCCRSELGDCVRRAAHTGDSSHLGRPCVASLGRRMLLRLRQPQRQRSVRHSASCLCESTGLRRHRAIARFPRPAPTSTTGTTLSPVLQHNFHHWHHAAVRVCYSVVRPTSTTGTTLPSHARRMTDAICRCAFTAPTPAPAPPPARGPRWSPPCTHGRES